MTEQAEREKMAAGLWYDANYDKHLLEERGRAADLCFTLNHTRPGDTAARKKLLREIFPNVDKTVDMLSPIYCDYGYNVYIGKYSALNINCYLMDGAKITIGKHAFIGPFCGFYTANHPLDHVSRNKGLEKAEPITLGDNVWIGAHVVILPGVTIGSGSVIGAGSIVSKDIPAGVLAVGNPCKVIRKITKQDKLAQ